MLQLNLKTVKIDATHCRRSTRHSLGEDDYRGGHGPVGVTRHSMDNPLYHAFIEAGSCFLSSFLEIIVGKVMNINSSL